MSALADFHFLRPFALLLLLALPLAWLAWRSRGRDAGAWRDVVDAPLLPHLVERIERPGGRAGVLLATLGWAIACLALAGPAWEREPVPLHRDRNARVIALELAPSMLAQDERPSRLERARYKIADILARSRERQTALIAYAGEAFVVAPLTDDIGTVQNLVDALDPSTMPVAGNATVDAIRRAVELIEQAGLHRGEVVLVADSAGAGANAAARKARSAGVRVSVLGVGSPGGAPIPLAQGDFLKDDRGNVVLARLDEAGLRALADAGGGRYARIAADARDLDALLGDGFTATSSPIDMAEGTAEGTRWRDRGPWLLLLLLPLALAGFRRGWLMLLPFAILGATPSAHAGFFADLWQRRDQQAATALREGDAKRAAELAPSPAWRGAAAYREGDFAEAGKHYAEAAGADAAYNRGNALAGEKRYEDALAAYDEALQLDPAMEDAQANRDAVEAFLQQSKPPPSGERGDPSDENRPSASQQGEQPQSADGQQPSGEQEPQPQDGDGKSADEEGESSPESQAGEQKDGQRGESGSSAADAQSPPGEAGAKPDEQQQQALSKAIDQALQEQSGEQPPDEGSPVPAEDETTRERRQALEHWLRRVPDDPGGLLRRKFQLEYQRRQQRGGEEP